MLATLGTAFDHWAPALWFWFMLLVGLIWLRRHFDIARGKREPVLSRDDAGEGDADLPRLSMLVAAKDEEDNITRCAEGLLAQDYPSLQVIVVNDRSDDRTAEIIDQLAANNPRLSARHVHELPAGWFGKNNAMRVGVERADGQWLCFSDADCTYNSPVLLRAAIRFAMRENVEFLSVLPQLEAATFWERVVQPVAGAVMVFWFPPQRVNNPAVSTAYANGAFMLMPRAVYDKLGGHEPVKATLNEDMHLARRSKKLGLRLRVIRCDNLYSVRMYRGFRQIWRGWSRIFYGCLGTWPRLLASVLMLGLFSLSPYITLAVAPLIDPGGAWMAVAAGFAITLQQSVLWRFYSMTGNGTVWALSYPLGALICLGMTLSSIRRLTGLSQTTWRGTNYRRGA